MFEFFPFPADPGERFAWFDCRPAGKLLGFPGVSPFVVWSASDEIPKLADDNIGQTWPATILIEGVKLPATLFLWRTGGASGPKQARLVLDSDEKGLREAAALMARET